MKNKTLFILSLLLLSACYVYHPMDEKVASKKGEVQKTPIEQIENGKYYKITVDNAVYKVKTKEWQQDSLVVYLNGNEKKEAKFSKNAISKVEHRVFSRARSNALTFGTYGLVGALVYFLMK